MKPVNSLHELLLDIMDPVYHQSPHLTGSDTKTWWEFRDICEAPFTDKLGGEVVLALNKILEE